MQEVREFDSPRLHQTKARSAGVRTPADSRPESPSVEDDRDPGTGQRHQLKPAPISKAAALEKAKEHRKRLDAGIRDGPRLTEWLTLILPARVGPSTVENSGAAITGT